MTKTIILATIAATTILMLSLLSTSVFAPGPPKVCTQIDDSNCTFTLRWNSADIGVIGTPPGPPLVITAVSGSLVRQGLISETITGVEGELQGALVGTTKTISETTVVTPVGLSTITTTVMAQSRNVNNVQGQITIDGEQFSVLIKTPGYDSTQLQVTEEFTSPTSSQTAVIEKFSIPVVITMCNSDNSKCFQGFGTINREISVVSNPLFTTTFKSDRLEAVVISIDGLFELKLTFIQQIQA